MDHHSDAKSIYNRPRFSTVPRKKALDPLQCLFLITFLLAFLSFLPVPAVLSRARRTYTAALASKCDQGVNYNILALCFTGI